MARRRPASSILRMGAPAGVDACSGNAETPDHLVRDGLAPDAALGVTAGPDPGLAPLDREFAIERDAMGDVKARAAELADLGGDLDMVAELDRHMEARLRIDQRHPD